MFLKTTVIGGGGVAGMINNPNGTMGWGLWVGDCPETSGENPPQSGSHSFQDSDEA